MRLRVALDLDRTVEGVSVAAGRELVDLTHGVLLGK